MNIKKIIKEEMDDLGFVKDSGYIDMDVKESYKIWTFDMTNTEQLSTIEKLKNMGVVLSPNTKREINTLLNDEYEGRYKIVYMIVSPYVKNGKVDSEGTRWLNIQTNYKDDIVRDSIRDEFGRVRSIELTI
jgi:hypothetical protein